MGPGFRVFGVFFGVFRAFKIFSIMLMWGNAPVGWSSMRQPCASLSTAETELQASGIQRSTFIALLTRNVQCSDWEVPSQQAAEKQEALRMEEVVEQHDYRHHKY